MYALQNALDKCTRSQGNKNTRHLRHIFIRASCGKVLKQETLVHCEGKTQTVAKTGHDTSSFTFKQAEKKNQVISESHCEQD